VTGQKRYDRSIIGNVTTNIFGTIVSSITKNITGTLVGRITVVELDLLGNTIRHGNPFKIYVKNDKTYAELTECKGLQKWPITPDATALASINTQYGNPQLDYTREVKQDCGGVLGSL
jgi:hypothetical protein